MNGSHRMALMLAEALTASKQFSPFKKNNHKAKDICSNELLHHEQNGHDDCIINEENEYKNKNNEDK